MVSDKLILITPRSAVICFCVAMAFGFISFVCGGMVGYEQGQISVAGGVVDCVIILGEWQCEENVHE